MTEIVRSLESIFVRAEFDVEKAADQTRCRGYFRHQVLAAAA